MTFKIKALISFILIATSFSCSKNNIEDLIPSSASVSATISGEPWASINGGAIANLSTTTVGSTTVKSLQITGLKLDQSSLMIEIPMDNLVIGTYTFSGTSSDGFLVYSAAGGTNIFSSMENGGAFTITISALNITDGTLSGTFSGTLIGMNGASKTITNGVIDSVAIISSEMYSNGTMSLSRNGATAFTMGGSQSNANYVMLTESTTNNSLSIMGYNTALGVNFGVYDLTLPKNSTTGTYNLTNTGFSAGISNANNQPEYHLVSGSITVQSHNGNNIVGSFNYTVSNGSQQVTITNGSFNVTHH